MVSLRARMPLAAAALAAAGGHRPAMPPRLPQAPASRRPGADGHDIVEVEGPGCPEPGNPSTVIVPPSVGGRSAGNGELVHGMHCNAIVLRLMLTAPLIPPACHCVQRHRGHSPAMAPPRARQEASVFAAAIGRLPLAWRMQLNGATPVSAGAAKACPPALMTPCSLLLLPCPPPALLAALFHLFCELHMHPAASTAGLPCARQGPCRALSLAVCSSVAPGHLQCWLPVAAQINFVQFAMQVSDHCEDGQQIQVNSQPRRSPSHLLPPPGGVPALAPADTHWLPASPQVTCNAEPDGTEGS